MMRVFRLLVVAVSLAWSGSAQADGEQLNDLFLFLSEGNEEGQTPFIDDLPRVIGFEGNAQAVYSDHVTKSWQDPEIREYLANRLAPVMRFSEDGEPDIERFERVLGLMPLALSARGDYGVYRLTPPQKVAYVSALHSAFLVQADKGVQDCIEAHYQDFGDGTESLYKAARHKITLMKNMTAKHLQSYLQVQRAGVLAELRATSQAPTLTSDGLDQAFSHIDPVLDRLVLGHPMADRINDYWFNEADDFEAECEAFKLDWVVLSELEGEGLHLASQYYLEFFNGEH